MNAMSHVFDLSQATMLPPARPPAQATPRSVPDVAALALQWEAVHEAAAAVGQLAQLARDLPDAAVLDLPQRAAAMGGRRYLLAAHGIDDLAAMLQPGLRALLALTARGQDTTAAALTLWREFHTARSALLALGAAAE